MERENTDDQVDEGTCGVSYRRNEPRGPRDEAPEDPGPPRARILADRENAPRRT